MSFNKNSKTAGNVIYCRFADPGDSDDVLFDKFLTFFKVVYNRQG